MRVVKKMRKKIFNKETVAGSSGAAESAALGATKPVEKGFISVLTWGMGKMGRLGHNNTKNVRLPTAGTRNIYASY